MRLGGLHRGRMLKPLIISALLILLLSGSPGLGTDFRPDPVYEHIRIHGRGIDMSYVPADKVPNRNLKRKEGE